MDSIYILNQAKIPDVINVHINNLSDSIRINGMVSVNNSSYDSLLDCLLSSKNEIEEFGIGVSGVVPQITFPLIIAVFAFAFPFLFTAINHVNSKYDSEKLAKLFTSSQQYKTLWTSIITSIIFLLLYAALALFPYPSFHQYLGIIGAPISVAIAGWMVYSVICFMKGCILYNKPSEMVEEIEKRYKEEKKSVGKRQ